MRGYWRGCKCRACRAAKAAYVAALRRQQREATEILSAEPLRQLFLRWASRGLGCRQIARCIRMSETWVRAIKSGRLTVVRGITSRRILETKPARACGATVSAWRTRKLIDALLSEEFTPAQIAAALGRPSRGIVFGPRVRIRTELKVERLYRKWIGEHE